MSIDKTRLVRRIRRVSDVTDKYRLAGKLHPMTSQTRIILHIGVGQPIDDVTDMYKTHEDICYDVIDKNNLAK